MSWTPEGKRWQEAFALDMQRAMREALWAMPRKCKHEMLRLDGDEFVCHACNRKAGPTGPKALVWKALIAGATDPLRRFCVKHEAAYMDDGGGPGPFSFCPVCMGEAYSKKAT